MTGRKDIRAVRTRQAIIAAMRSLLAGKRFADMTTNDLCREAGVSRTTFYQHFEDKYDLALAWIQADIKPPSELFAEETLEQYFTQLLEAEKKHCAQIRNLTQKGIAQELQWRIIGMWAEGLTRYYGSKQKQGAAFLVPYEVMATYDVAGIFFVVWWMIEHDFEYPIDKMVSYLVRRLQQSKAFIYQ